MKKLNKASQETLTELSKFLKGMPKVAQMQGVDKPYVSLEDAVKQAKALSKALTQLRADIKECEEAPVAEPEGKAQYEVKIDNGGVIEGFGLNQPMVQLDPVGEPVVDLKRDLDIIAAQPAPAPAAPADEYVTAVFVSQAQLDNKSPMIGARQQAEGNFTVELFRKK